MKNKDNPGVILKWLQGVQNLYVKSVKLPEMSKQRTLEFINQTTVANLSNVRLIAVLLILEDILLLTIVGLLSIRGLSEEFSTLVQISWTNTIIFVPIAVIILLFIKVPGRNEISAKHNVIDNLIISVIFAGVLISCLWTGDSTFYLVAVLLFSLVISKPVNIMSAFYLVFLLLYGLGMMAMNWQTDRIVSNLAESLRITAIGFLIFWIRLRNNMLIFQREKLINSQNAELMKANSILRDLSLLDPLTQIPNRRSFERHLAVEWKRAAREGIPLSVLLIDIDYFKNYNDCYGHLTGDNCLNTVASALQKCIGRVGDMVARYGGEEFVVILPNNDTKGAIAFAEKLRKVISDLNIPHELSPLGYVSISIGAVSLRPDKQSTSSVLLEAADKALYLAKGNGRNQVQSALNI